MSVTDKTNDLAAIITDNISGVENGVISTNKDTFEKTLPEGITMDVYNACDGHKREVVAAAALAMGRKGNELMSKDTELKEVSIDVKAGRDSITGAYLREKEIRNPTTGDVSVKHGYAQMNVRSTISKGSSGPMAKVKALLEEEAQSLIK